MCREAKAVAKLIAHVLFAFLFIFLVYPINNFDLS